MEGIFMKKSQNIFQVLSTLLTKLGLKSKIKSYSGDFKNGHYHGKGRLEFTDGSVYEGQFENNKMHGYGKIFYKDGSIYQGNFKNNLRDGTGKVRSKEGVEQRVVYSKDRFKEVYSEEFGIIWEKKLFGKILINATNVSNACEKIELLSIEELIKNSILDDQKGKFQIVDITQDK